jgi:hypothetical protein
MLSSSRILCRLFTFSKKMTLYSTLVIVTWHQLTDHFCYHICIIISFRPPPILEAINCFNNCV